jgi:hypothetical protein
MLAKPNGLEEVSVFRGIGPAIGLAAALALFPAKARAQVNIDQGKSPAEIYSSDCATCHKTPHGLAAGKNSLALSAFLREHYTASRDQASAVAAYVLSIGGAEPAPRQKPEVEHARTETPKSGQAKGEPKTVAHPIRAAAKPEPDEKKRVEEEKRAKQEEAKREEHPVPPIVDGTGVDRASVARGNTDRDVVHPETASRGERAAPEDAAPATPQAEPVAATPAVSAAPHAAEAANPTPDRAPSMEFGSMAKRMAPAGEGTSAGVAVPRDNIPD